MEQFLNEIMPALVQFASVVVLGLIGWATSALKTWLNERGALEKLQKYDYLADIAVKAVEQIYKNENGNDKFEQAKEIFLDSLPDNADVTYIQLDAFIESAVKRMNDEWEHI